jgi:hypothetical protein
MQPSGSPMFPKVTTRLALTKTRTTRKTSRSNTSSTPINEPTHSQRPSWAASKGLPWTPKVRQEEIDRFIRQSREKFVGVVLPEDTATLVGLPKPIEESIQIMRKHVYVSLCDVQITKEEGMSRYPLSQVIILPNMFKNLKNESLLKILMKNTKETLDL